MPTPDALRAEAEKVAREVLCTYITDRANLAIPSDVGVNAIVAFAEHHAAQAVKRARLEGRIAQALWDHGHVCANTDRWTETSNTLRVQMNELRAELAALERGDKEAG